MLKGEGSVCHKNVKLKLTEISEGYTVIQNNFETPLQKNNPYTKKIKNKSTITNLIDHCLPWLMSCSYCS